MSRAHTQKGEYSRRLILGRIRTPFDLAASQTIYSPLAKSNGSTHSSFAVEEQRREGHHSGEERVELIF
jgi:hypothetical protein